MQFRFYNPETPATVTQGHLPHWDQEGATYFITWRTADSIPKKKWDYWRRERLEWLKNHGIDPSEANWRKHLEELTEPQRRDFRRFAKDLENEIDSCHGECPLRDPACAKLVEDSIRHLDGKTYLLGDFMIMPNHAHLLVGAMSRDRMLFQVSSWKKWSAIQINRLLERKGRLWQDESFDHLVREQGGPHSPLCGRSRSRGRWRPEPRRWERVVRTVPVLPEQVLEPLEMRDFGGAAGPHPLGTTGGVSFLKLLRPHRGLCGPPKNLACPEVFLTLYNRPSRSRSRGYPRHRAPRRHPAPSHLMIFLERYSKTPRTGRSDRAGAYGSV